MIFYLAQVPAKKKQTNKCLIFFFEETGGIRLYWKYINRKT